MKQRARRSPVLLRRYPALVFVVAAGALALLLPSALNIPQSGPSTLAEFGPVPGAGEGQSSISTLEQAQSGGLGFGSSGGLGRKSPLNNDLGTPSQKRSRLKRCVGSPPRQTEDPLSPPCVAFFEGDNGGATARGVSRDEVNVAIYSTAARQGVDDFGEPIGPGDTSTRLWLKAYMKYFNDRYQTFGRSVHLFGSRPSGTSAETRRTDAGKSSDAFATLSLVGNVETYVTEAARLGVVSFDHEAYSRSVYQKYAPYLITYLPDLDDQGRIWASYICLRRVGGMARFSGNPQDVTRPREFGLLHESNPSNSAYDYLAGRLKDELVTSCGLRIKSEASVTSGGSAEQSAQQMALALAKLRGDEVTTVIVIGTGPLLYTNGSAAQGWYPEWMFGSRIGPFGLDVNDAARQYNQASWRHASGISYDIRRSARTSQPWYVAFKEACPNCEEPTVARSASNMYDALNLLFYGIQSAGPHLTSRNLDKGLHAIPARKSPNSFTPAAYFSPGNYSYIKDAMEIWWDPTGTDPTDGQPGCYRLTHDGLRNRAGEWPDGDSGAFQTGVCQAGIG